jgi:type IV secretion system protein VirB2
MTKSHAFNLRAAFLPGAALPSRCCLLARSASGTGMPWETPLNNILESVQGPVAKIIAVIVIITTGLTLAFGETAGGFRRLIQIVFGLSIAFAASSFLPSSASAAEPWSRERCRLLPKGSRRRSIGR